MGLVQIVFLAKLTEWHNHCFFSLTVTTLTWCWIWRTSLFCLPILCRYSFWLITEILVVFYSPVHQGGGVLLVPLSERTYVPKDVSLIFFLNEQLPVSKSRLCFLTGMLKTEKTNIRWTSVCLCSTVCLNNPGWVESDGWGDGGDVGSGGRKTLDKRGVRKKGKLIIGWSDAHYLFMWRDEKLFWLSYIPVTLCFADKSLIFRLVFNSLWLKFLATFSILNYG